MTLKWIPSLERFLHRFHNWLHWLTSTSNRINWPDLFLLASATCLWFICTYLFFLFLMLTSSDRFLARNNLANCIPESIYDLRDTLTNCDISTNTNLQCCNAVLPSVCRITFEKQCLTSPPVAAPSNGPSSNTPAKSPSSSQNPNVAPAPHVNTPALPSETPDTNNNDQNTVSSAPLVTAALFVSALPLLLL